MGLFSFFKKNEENYEQILSSLEQEIQKAEKQKNGSVRRMEWWSRNWVFYMGIGWVAYAAGFVLYVWPERHASHAEGFATHLLALLIIPLVLYYGRAMIRGVGQRSINKHERHIAELKKQLKERVEELKKKTAFDTTKTLIDRYSVKDERALSPAEKLRVMEAKNRRQTTPNFTGSPGGLQRGGDAAPLSPLAGRGGAGAGANRMMGMQMRQQQQQGNPNIINASVPPPMGTGIVKMPGRGASLQPMDSPVKGNASRPWLDKLVDQLVGDVGGADDRYALVCRHCYAHNGLVLEEEVNDIQYNCPKCGKFNPSLRSLRLQSRIGSQQILRSSADNAEYEEYSDYEGGSAAEDDDGSGEPVDLEDKSIQADISREFGSRTPGGNSRVARHTTPANLARMLDDEEEDDENEDEGRRRVPDAAPKTPVSKAVASTSAAARTPRTPSAAAAPKVSSDPIFEAPDSDLVDEKVSAAGAQKTQNVAREGAATTPAKSGGATSMGSPRKRRTNKPKPAVE
ncbi:hypothetical protein GGI07_005433 [Coemansia sp. Benny D115]|nr:hypothetical protein GGI07_005433 [Coemansia sp. Benny D115]